MKFGLFGGPARPQDANDSQGYRDYVRFVTAGEALGFYAVFLVEHHFTGFGQVSASLNLLSYLAARTTTMRLGTAVVVLPWHNPMLLAEQAATVDVLSDGRLELGVGRGYRYNEFRGFGISMDEATERYEETLALIKQAWSTRERFSYESCRWKFVDAVLEPAPVQQPLPPIWVGASSSDSIGKAARDGYKLLLNQTSSFETIANCVRLYRESVEAAGRTWNPADVGVTRALFLTLNKDDAWVERVVATRAARERRLSALTYAQNDPRLAHPEIVHRGDALEPDVHTSTLESVIMGTPDDCIATLKRLEADGVQQVLINGGTVETLQTFAREVMPAFA